MPNGIFKPFSILEIFRYIIPGVLLFYLIIYPFINIFFPWWQSFNVSEKIAVSLIISVVIGILLEPLMTLLGLFVLSHPKVVPKKLKKIDMEIINRRVDDSLFRGIWIVINESEKELLWHTTAMYYMYASCSLILFINAIIYFVKLVLDAVQLGVFSNETIINFFIFSFSGILSYACLHQVIVYLKIKTNYLSYISNKYKKEIEMISDDSIKE